MLIFERQQKIIEILRQRKSAQLDDLARELGVSASTVRRDLEQLERTGQVQRTHGGAVYRNDGHQTFETHSDALAARLNEQVDAKLAIGRYAASLVEPHMTLLLDGGSTVIYTVRQITVRPIQVVTNSLAIANHFADDDQVELTIIGGQLYPRTGVLVGPLATASLAELHADLCFFSLAAIHHDGAYNLNLEMAKVEQMMIQQAARSVMLMDATKFGRKSLARVCSFDEVDLIVTDTSIDSTWRESLGERLIVAE